MKILKNISKKIAALGLAVALMTNSFPATAFAAETVDPDSKATENAELVEEKLTVKTGADTAEAETYGKPLYTVEFTYDDMQYVMPRDSEIALSEILDKVGLTGEATEVSVSDSSLFSVAPTRQATAMLA